MGLVIILSAMLSQTGKVGITLIGLPGSGKSALAKRMNIK
jgi:predicted ATPase with chaperone activity